MIVLFSQDLNLLVSGIANSDVFLRLRMAQEIQRKLEETEVKQRELESRGVTVEKSLRGEGGINNIYYNTSLTSIILFGILNHHWKFWCNIKLSCSYKLIFYDLYLISYFICHYFKYLDYLYLII